MSKPLTMTVEQEKADRAASRFMDRCGMAEAGSADAAALRAWTEVDAHRAALADERKHADALKEGLAACVGERATFYAGQTQTVTWAVAIEHAERLLSDHRARRAAEVANGA